MTLKAGFASKLGLTVSHNTNTSPISHTNPLRLSFCHTHTVQCHLFPLKTNRDRVHRSLPGFWPESAAYVAWYEFHLETAVVSTPDIQSVISMRLRTDRQWIFLRLNERLWHPLAQLEEPFQRSFLWTARPANEPRWASVADKET